MGYSVERLKDGISDAERNIAEMTRVIVVERERIATHKKLITEALIEAEKEAKGEVNG
jgi:hypothetical protein